MRKTYNNRLVEEVAASTQRLADDVAHTRAALFLVAQREIEDAKDKRKPMRLSDCRFSPEEVEAMTASFELGSWTRRASQKRRLLEVPSAPPADLQARMSAVSVQQEPGHARPEWLSAVCGHRDHFSDTAFLVRGATGVVSAYKFMYAMQNPLMVAFCPLQKQPCGLISDTVVNWDSAPALFMASQVATYRVDWTDVVREFDLPSLDVASVAVLPCLFYAGSNNLRSCADSLPLDAFLLALGPLRAASTRAPRAASSAGHSASGDVLAAFPWLTAMFAKPTEDPAAETIDNDDLVLDKTISDEPFG